MRASLWLVPRRGWIHRPHHGLNKMDEHILSCNKYINSTHEELSLVVTGVCATCSHPVNDKLEMRIHVFKHYKDLGVAKYMFLLKL